MSVHFNTIQTRSQSINTSERIGERVSIYQRRANWYANYMESGCQRRVSLKTKSKKQAKVEASKIENRLLSGRSEQKRVASSSELFQAYRDHIESGNLAIKTKQKYRYVLDLVEKYLGTAGPRAELGPVFLDRYQVWRRQKRSVSESTLHDDCIIIKQVAKYGVQRQLLVENPFSGYKLREPRATPQPCWTDREGRSIIDAAREPYRTAFLVLLETGMRSGELTHLRFDDIDFENNVILIREKSWQEGGREHTWRPKSGDLRAVPMQSNTRTVLQQLKRKVGWVFCAPASRKYPDGDHRLSETRLLKALKPILRKLSLPGKVHTFRHAFISTALARGTPSATVRNWVGHVDDEILRRYTHITDQDSQQQMKRLERERHSDSQSE